MRIVRREDATAPRRRLDAELVRRGLARSREHARELVTSGSVLVGGAPVDKPDRLLHPGDALVVAAPPPRFVGRGGLKLAAALDHFDIDPQGRRCLDAGASTGGFTDCLLQRGARQVWAVDVGRNQLHERLLADPRVVVRDRCNIRALEPSDTDGPFELVVGDLSFISLRLVARQLVELTMPGATLVVLVKPQFEAGRAEASRGRGVIRDPDVWRRVLVEVLDHFEACGGSAIGVLRSPLTGGDGNVEFLARITRTAPSSHPAPDPRRPGVEVRLGAELDGVVSVSPNGSE
ncbi:MAG: TlyA family RNA methyltransferase [Acidimicrobiia bacterium]|nr:TlyA family RNA methyltransferase [Acidimicrobiia bacterium]